MREVLDFFYDHCAEAVWEEDGLLNKAMGDGLLAVFNFPLSHPDHPRRAVRAAREIRRRCAEACGPAAGRLGLDPARLGVGVGVHTGPTAFGEFGRLRREVTAIGSVVNLAARLQGAAGAWEVLVSREVLDAAGADREVLGARELDLKGFARPVPAFSV